MTQLFTLAGTKYAKYPIKNLRVGMLLKLVPEPDNPVDANAIRVDDEHGVKVGYVPKHLTKKITHAHATVEWLSSKTIIVREKEIAHVASVR